MKHVALFTALLAGSASAALAHPSIQDHAHPHTDAASYFTIETLIIFTLGLSIGATLAWTRRKRDMNK